jgi:hypothetical protein
MTPMQKAADPVSDAATGRDVESVLVIVADVLGRLCGDAKTKPEIKLLMAWENVNKTAKTIAPYRLYRVTDRDGSDFSYLTRLVGDLGHPTEIIVRYDTAVGYPGGKRVCYRTAVIRGENGKVTRLDTYAQDPKGKWVLCHSTDSSVQESKAKTPLHPLKKTPRRTIRR